MLGRLKLLTVALLSGAIWVGAQTNASAAAIDLGALGLVADPAGPFITQTGTGLSDFNGSDYSYIGDLSLDPSVGIISVGTGDTDFTLALNAFSGDSLSAISTSVMDSSSTIDILFSIISDTIGVGGSHILASITHNDPLLFGANVLSAPSVDIAASISLTSVAPIPLPPGIVLLVSALGGLIVMRRRRSA